MVPGKTLVTSLSFTHLNELMAIEDPLKRTFYEVESIRGGWSVRELKRQIGSLYFERSGLSRDKKKLAALVQTDAEIGHPSMAVRDPYVFEFLGLRSREVMGESDLEDALLDKLQDFLLELGHGFCFEAGRSASSSVSPTTSSTWSSITGSSSATCFWNSRWPSSATSTSGSSTPT